MNNDKRTECVVYARVVGWMTPIKCFNKGKQAEYIDRKVYKIKQNNDRR